MKILKAFQVIDRAGSQTISATYNEVDEKGNIISQNEKDSFYAVDQALIDAINTVKSYIIANRLNN